MKKEYKTPQLSIVNMDVESPMMEGSKNEYEWGEAKKNGRGFVDDEEDVAPATPKNFWDDED